MARVHDDVMTVTWILRLAVLSAGYSRWIIQTIPLSRQMLISMVYYEGPLKRTMTIVAIFLPQ
jgi:hypothetical protein